MAKREVVFSDFERGYIERNYKDKTDERMAKELNTLRDGYPIQASDIKKYRDGYPGHPLTNPWEEKPSPKITPKRRRFRLPFRIFGSCALAALYSCGTPPEEYKPEVQTEKPGIQRIYMEFDLTDYQDLGVGPVDFSVGLRDKKGVSWGIKELCEIYKDMMDRFHSDTATLSLADGAIVRSWINRALLMGGEDAQYIRNFFRKPKLD